MYVSLSACMFEAFNSFLSWLASAMYNVAMHAQILEKKLTTHWKNNPTVTMKQFSAFQSRRCSKLAFEMLSVTQFLGTYTVRGVPELNISSCFVCKVFAKPVLQSTCSHSIFTHDPSRLPSNSRWEAWNCWQFAGCFQTHWRYVFMWECTHTAHCKATQESLFV